ncbi:hypothetical protein [Effusibacillus dendaii]|nr:hypothetical protein [Effusibacillus dendaii]
MVVVMGVFLQTTVTTFYLGKIYHGLNTSLDSTSRLITVQKAIIDKNKSLQNVMVPPGK